MRLGEFRMLKGIILAGGSGTRLHPITKGVSKQLLPIYDKPMIYYPLSVLMLAGIREILIITTAEDAPSFKKLLGTGESFGISLTYEVQLRPNGIPEAFIIGEKFIGDNPVALILGDNIFYGQGFVSMIKNAIQSLKEGAGGVIFCQNVADPNRFGVAEFDENKKVARIQEKPIKPKSNFAVTGLYFFDNSVVAKAKLCKPSERGELEISDLHRQYIDEKKLEAGILGRGLAWLDAGTMDSLLDASNFVATLQKRQGKIVACLEEISYKKGWINKEQLEKICNTLKNLPLKKYLQSIIHDVE